MGSGPRSEIAVRLPQRDGRNERDGVALTIAEVADRRLQLVDALRGFALFGVVVSNVAVFAGTGAAAVPESSLGHSLGLLMAYLITGKFLALFALLFGVSFGLQLRRCAERGEPAAGRYLRRLGSLLFIGMVHRVLFGADILMTYAVLGVVLLLLHNASNRVLLLGAVLSLGLPELWRTLAEWIHYQPPPPVISRADRLRLATEGPYLELVRVRIALLTGWWRQLLPELDTLALFLLGLWSARRGLLERLAEQRVLLHGACWGGLALAIGGNLAQVALRPSLASGASWVQASFGIVWNATTFVQAIFYGAGIALLWSWSGRARRLLGYLIPAGRMALTNYLAVSILVTLIVASTGSYGRLTLAAAVGFGVLLWFAELAWSSWWLQRHRVGPAEWLWRTLTYWRLQPMRILRTRSQPG